MPYLGYIDSISAHRMRGWAFDTDNPQRPVTIEILGDGLPLQRAVADIYRDDLRLSGIGDGRHAFEVEISQAVWGRMHLAARILGSGFYLIDNTIRDAKRHRERFQNAIMDGLPEYPCGFSHRVADDIDRRIAAEIIGMWRGLPSSSPPGGAIWDVHVRDSIGEFESLVGNDDVPGLAAYLVSLPTKRAANGILQGVGSYLALQAPVGPLNDVVAPIADALLSLAQYVGAARVETPEQGPLGRAIFTPVHVLRAGIETELGHAIMPRTVFNGLFGLAFEDGILHMREISALYAALRATRLATGPAPRICEIGGGFGHQAYHAWSRGVRHYTIVDLPLISMLQYYYLRRSLPDAEVRCHHDAAAPVPPAPGIDLVLADVFASIETPHYDVVVNCDSFPEMGDPICLAYLNGLRGRADTLLSINQEAACPLTADAAGPLQSIVAELVAGLPGFVRRDRLRSWVRKGYVEEVWSIPQP